MNNIYYDIFKRDKNKIYLQNVKKIHIFQKRLLFDYFASVPNYWSQSQAFYKIIFLNQQK